MASVRALKPDDIIAVYQTAENIMAAGVRREWSAAEADE